MHSDISTLNLSHAPIVVVAVVVQDGVGVVVVVDEVVV